ncbi:indolethylamine N-methyltransferase-like [Eleutherodactylus coqui]|uniref:indolethylamine N-methyltransferase-like n=1 Tax=Eleutherodactylus coqui TaxID=57060 RepID=UPI003461863B
MEKAHYHDKDDHSEAYYRTILSRDADPLTEQVIQYPAQKLLSALGSIGRCSVIDLVMGLDITHLIVLLDTCHDITVLNANAHNAAELEKWRQNKPDALDFSHAIKKVCDLIGSRERAQELEVKLRKKMKRILHCDFTKENIADPHVLPKVDCILSVWGLGPVSKDQASYTDNMKKLASLLNVGGKMVMIGGLNASEFTIGRMKYHTVLRDEKMERMALSAAGCSIKSFQVDASKIPDHHMDNTHVHFTLAVKEHEV